VLLGGVVLASRPLWLVVRQDPNDPGSRFVGRLQRGQGLEVDGGRTYAEHSVNWVSWWVGPITVLMALVVFAALTDRFVRWWQSGRTEVPGWFAPAFIGFGSTLLSLYRPGITPDHPWADRRLVPIVLPTVILAAVAGLVWAVARARQRWPQRARVVVPTIVVLGSAALLVPPLIGTLPVAGVRTEVGQLRAHRLVCGALEPDDVVIAVGSRALNEWPQVVRSVCGNPAGAVNIDVAKREELVAAVTRAAERIEATGRRPVLLAGNRPEVFTWLGLEPVQVAHVRSTEDPRLLTERPGGARRLDMDVWLAPWQ
jgi:hypothetical protein